MQPYTNSLNEMETKIAGVIVSKRRQITDERGKIAHMLRADDPEFQGFGEVYFSWVNSGWVKAWHLHSEMTLNYVCPYGEIRLALFDTREGSLTQGSFMALTLSPEEYSLVTVPPGVWNGFQGIAEYASLVCNCATLAHDPGEIIRREPDDPMFPKVWNTL